MTRKLYLGLVLVLVLLFSACTPQPGNTHEPHGQISEGLRLISIETGFSKQEIKVYRGETLKITYEPKKDNEVRIVIDGLDVDETYHAGDEAAVVVKVKETGSYPLTVVENNKEEKGQLEVSVYEKENVFVNARVEEFKAAMEGDYLLLDVRTMQEYQEGHIDGAVLIPVSELEDRLDEVKDYKDKRVLVYCRSGNRSIVASQILIDNGFGEVYNLIGGFSVYQ